MIVAVYDTGSDDRHEPPLPYIVMEYVDGRTVREVLQHDGRLTQSRALEIVVDVCAALDYSHRAGIVHRDIKPGNVMITREDGSVKVMDFGIARAVAQSTATVTQTAAVMGTAQYLSPEQARGETVDARSDLYSTGVVLYELLTGQPPFQGDSPVAVAYQHVRETATPPSDIEPDLPPDVDAVVMKSLAKNPANRYQNAAEMSDDLGRIFAGRRVLATPLLREPAARPAPPPRRPRPDRARPSRRRVLLISLLSLLAVAAVALGLLLARSPTKADVLVAVPPVEGMSLSAAKHVIEQNGLAVGKQTAKTSTAKIDTVLSSDPPVGTKLNKNAPVALTYSSGPGSAAIPPVTGQPVAAAEKTLRDLGFTTATTEVADPTKPPGTVSATQPAAGTLADIQTVLVTLSVVNNQTSVPPVIGLDQAVAEGQLSAADLQFTVVQSDSTNPNGQVLDQSVQGGSLRTRGSTVILTVSHNPPTPTPTKKPKPTRTPRPKPTAKPSATPTPGATPSG